MGFGGHYSRVPALVALFLAIPAPGQSGVQNAAVKYLRSDAALRQSYPLPPDAALKLEKALVSPLDDEDDKLVAAAVEALTELQRGSVLKKCDWVMSMEDGPLANTAHRGAIREMVAVSGIRARIRFRKRDSEGAMDDILAAMTAARHLSLDGSLASVLIAYRLENMISPILARDLNLLTRSQLQELAMRLDALPSGSTLGKALEDEEVAQNRLFVIADGARSRDDLIERLLKMAPYLQSDRALATEIIDECKGSVSGFVMCVEQQRSFSAHWAARFAVTPEQFEKEYTSEVEPLSQSNPIIRVMTPNLARFRWTEAYTQTRRALLRAAIAVWEDGPKALEHHTDPYDGQPFAYTPITAGFRLKSRLTEAQKPISLDVEPDIATQK